MEHAEIDRLVMKPTARRRLGKYVLLGRLGHGGMGKIYLAYAPGPAGIEKLLVVKRLHSHLTGDQVLVNSFLDEARLSMALNHPNIVHTYDVGEVEGRYFMVMEYIEGQNLGVVLRTAKRSNTYPPSSLWAGLFLSVLDGLHAAHIARDARGRPLQIIHRDVSPQNVLVTYEGLPKLVDFGIAKAAMRVSETDAGVLKGKYAYMSPEQVRGEPLDPRSDVFAAGIVLWEMLAGRRLYKADTIVRSVERILTEPVISPVRVNSECDPELARVAFKALQKDRGQRFESALEMKEALDDALRKSGVRFRQSEARDLMHTLFGDVIEKQHAVLEACLAQGEQAAPLVDDDDALPRRASDSESDVSMNALRAEREDRSEVTTPSAMRQSPLVTADGEREQDGTRTSLSRKKKGSAASPGLVGDQAAAALQPPPAPTRLNPQPGSQGSQPATISHLSPLGRVEATATETDRAAPPKSRRAAAAAIVVLLVASALLAFVVVPRLGAGSSGSSDALAKSGLLNDVPDAVPAPEPVPDPVVTRPPPDPVEAAPDPAPPVATPEPVAPEPALAEPVVDDKRDRPRLPRRTPPREDKKPDVKVADKPDPKRDEALEEPRVGAGGGVGGVGGGGGGAGGFPGAAGELGTLSLDTVPWTVVYLGKKKLGETPLVKVPVPAGPLELLLVNPEANVKEPYNVTVKPGQDYKARLDLN